jgi:hypothetical protein
MVKQTDPVYVSLAVEGMVDEILARRLLNFVGGFDVAGCYGKAGKDSIKQKIDKYNQAAKLLHWFVLIDLDQDASCAPQLKAGLLPDPAQLMFFRVAVRSIESWLLADRERIAGFLGVSEDKVPSDPERLLNPKEQMINLARRSKNAAIRRDMVPRADSGINEGPAYNARLIEFINHETAGWRPNEAGMNSDSLKRCLDGLRVWKQKLAGIDEARFRHPLGDGAKET